jgi:hypothetical protein
MNKGLIQKLLPHFIAVAIFVVVAAIYCKPVLQGQVLQQSDVVQWKAMAKNSFDYKDAHGHFPLWTNGMFSGMPAYQIAMEPKVVVTPNWFFGIFTLYLPKPISYFFLACICFYFLTQVLRINPYLGIFGALAYAYATYNPVIVAVGHDTKMQTIALMPGLIASLILIYERKYLWGAALLAIFAALMVSFSHMQIIYYSLIIATFMTIGYMVHWVRQKNYKHLALSIGIAIGAGLIGVASNAVQIWTALDASKTTIRGGTELPDANSTKSGLSKSYALDYSMYKTEPFVMMVPKMYGGSDNLEVSEDDSKAIGELQQMPKEAAQIIQRGLHFYWGGIGGTSGPPYVGAIICFLTFIGFFLLDNKHKWWMLAATVITIMMSWGAYFEGFNAPLLKLLPMYNKFRAPSMIIVIPTFLFCMMAMMTLQKIIATPDKDLLWQRYKKGLLLTAGIFAVLVMIYLSADFTGASDKPFSASLQNAYGDQIMPYVNSFMKGLKEDRKGLFMGSLLRSFFFVVGAAVLIWLAIKKKLAGWIMFLLVGVLAFIDVMQVDVKYLNAENYQDAADYENNFRPTYSDVKIEQDTSSYRVFDLRSGAHNSFNGGALAAYFHHLIGGYHPAKLSIYQDLVEHQLVKDNIEQQLYVAPGSIPVVNMLNVKYIILPMQQGDSAVINPAALGDAWFVKGVRYEESPQAVMNALSNFNPKDTAIVFAKDKDLVAYTPAADSSASIRLLKNDNDEVTYASNAAANRFAVFSEIFYDRGWKAYIDGKEAPIVRTDYALRGLSVPVGQHTIRFVFHPASFYTGEKLALVAGILAWLLVIGAAVQTYRRRTGKGAKA